MRVLFTTEGTYPYIPGGVTTWCDALVTGLPQHEFTVVAVVGNPHVSLLYRLPANVRVVPVPLWGAERVEEYLPRRGAVRSTAQTTRGVVARRFLPVFEELVDELVMADGDARVIGRCITALANFCVRYDLRKALRDERVWSLVLTRLINNPLYRQAPTVEAIDLARSLYRYLMPLALPVPPVDISHSSAAAFCALPAVVAKLRDGVPLIVTEHGIFLRERILQLVHDRVPLLRKIMFANLYHGVTQAVCQHADVIAPVCSYNLLWERHLGIGGAKVRVIHNGVDPARFALSDGRQNDGQACAGDQHGRRRGGSRTKRPTVAYVGRFDPLKDVLTLISAAALVRDAVPDVLFRLYGAEADEDYARRCRRAVSASRLEGTVCFEGPTDDVESAYRDADLVVLSSLSEGFPFAVVEAMMSARPIVATAVGGISEALAGWDLLVRPRDPRSLSVALVRLLELPASERAAIGATLRQRAMSLFSRQRFLASYAALYEELHARAS